MIEFLENDLPPQGVGFSFVYCNHKESSAQSIEYFISAIVRQLVERRQTIPQEVRTLYEKHQGKETSPTLGECLTVIQSLSKDCSEVYIVIDALDECIDKNGQMLWNELLDKLEDSVHNIRLLYTSRHMENAEGVLKNSTQIDIRASEADMKAYVQMQLKSNYRLLGFCKKDPKLEEAILEVVVSKADGM